MREFTELDKMQEERTRSYERFERHGDDFLDVMLSGVPKLEDTWISAEQILEASEEEKGSFNETGGNRIFTSIYNLLCDVEILPAFHNSPPYEINRAQYDPGPVIEAWEHVSGEEYVWPESREGAPSLEESLYQQLKD
jgi:hypothetical protein